MDVQEKRSSLTAGVESDPHRYFHPARVDEMSSKSLEMRTLTNEASKKRACALMPIPNLKAHTTVIFTEDHHKTTLK